MSQAWTMPAGPAGNPWPPAGGGARRGRRTRRVAVVAVVAAAVGVAGVLVTVRQEGDSSGGAVLTTEQVASRVDPALVDINTTLAYQQAEAAGTGLVLTSSGEVLTNNHVIEGATSITATDIGNGQTYRAVVVGYDRSHDIAVLKLQGASGLDTVALGSSSTTQPGQKVVAIGNAGGRGGTPSVVTGQILALNASITASDASAGTSEQLTGLIKHNAPIQPGDSGGPLANTTGQVIGIDTAASTSDFEFQGKDSQTEGFAIPINEAISIADQIEASHGSAQVHLGATGFLGVEVTSDKQAQEEGLQAGAGALVAGIISGSPAEQAGLTANDVITAVNGQQVSSALDLQSALQQHHPGDKVTIGWTTQGGTHQSATVALASGPAG